ncbi:sure-like protein [Punctularia strigosozonata HHB-11173 SS5]|uniref:sure-like protein n=1 Tax=Punctularia strigosozonata (strain HHB-11173) TaxID=741275 RepID=UPI0004417193|nr:sure-like protein [Punctularia strigosozonata HHB-11173 SS5]EIN05796.1 sure-like protein [Punctularia strigosozonata HHB-11173 SS5]
MISFPLLALLLSSSLLAVARPSPHELFHKLVLTNDDGWAALTIRAQNDALKKAGFDVILSAPAVDKSGTGSSDAPATVVTNGCEYGTCPAGAPATGFNASDPRLNYVNAFPVDAARFGIQTLSPKFFHSKPDFVFSGPNVGNNLGSTVLISGTVGAATEAAKEGIPSVGFSASGSSTAQVSYANASSALATSAATYAELGTIFTQKLLSTPKPILPRNITLNVNYPATGTNCTQPSDFKFVFSRIFVNTSQTDVEHCGSDHLPDETTVVGTTGGCFVSVSVMNAVTKSDVDAKTQAFVLRKIKSLLSCLP